MVRRLDESREYLRGLVRGILQDRSNSERYLVLADYLEEDGDPLGDLVRLSVHLHNDDIPERDRRQMYERWAGLASHLGELGVDSEWMHGQYHVPMDQVWRYSHATDAFTHTNLDEIDEKTLRQLIVLLCKQIVVSPGSNIEGMAMHRTAEPFQMRVAKNLLMRRMHDLTHWLQQYQFRHAGGMPASRQGMLTRATMAIEEIERFLRTVPDLRFPANDTWYREMWFEVMDLLQRPIPKAIRDRVEAIYDRLRGPDVP